MTTGERLRAKRDAMGLTQAQLAALLEMEQMNISNWERGVTTPTVQNLARLATAFGCTLDELVPREELAS